MVKIVKNKYVNAALWMMIFSAALHMALLFYLALSRGDLYILNYFNVMDFDVFLPLVFKNNFSGNLASLISWVLIYFLFLKITSKNGKEK